MLLILSGLIKHFFLVNIKEQIVIFSNSELAASNLPTKEELILLEPFKNKLPKEIFNQTFKNPINDGSGDLRTNLRIANKLLYDAGWIVKDGKRINEKSGIPLKFTILLVSPEFERICLTLRKKFKKNWNRSKS